MKIAIVTMTGENYGSALQAYALQHSFAELGADTGTIRYGKRTGIRSKVGRLMRLIKSNQNGRLNRLHSAIKNKNKAKKINDFYNTKLHMIDVDNLEKADELYLPHIYVCGSDQIWNPQFQPSSLFYLDFCKRKVKKYSYACSLAVEKLSPDQEKYYKEKLVGFSGISVREETGQKILKEVLKNKVVRSDIDPVLLYEAEKWSALESGKYSEGGYILLYMLRPSDELINFTEKFSKSVGKKAIYLGDYYYKSKNIIFSGNDGVEDFLSAIIHADYVITNSFHATAFSVIFEKNFCSMVIERTGSRVRDFLKMVHLEDRIINENTLIDNILRQPDYKETRNVLVKKRATSLRYLNTIYEMKEQ